MGRCHLQPEEARTPQQKELLSLSDSMLAELEEADEYVFGVPMHNFGVPSVLNLWIDQIARVGRTFSYAGGRPKGLIIGKKATFVIATGGSYNAQTQMASFNFVEPYLRSVFGFLGLTDATFLTRKAERTRSAEVWLPSKTRRTRPGQASTPQNGQYRGKCLSPE